MKKVIREVKDFKPYITKRKCCFIFSITIAFFVDYLPFQMGIPLWIWFLIYLLLILYCYFVCLFIYEIITPSYKKIRKSDFDNLLINKGMDININKKRRIAPYIPFSKKIKYSCYDNNGTKVIYIFDLKNNLLKVISN